MVYRQWHYLRFVIVSRVRDGHHRISAAAALGQQEIDAQVTVWQVAAPAQAECAVVTRPQQQRSRAFLPRLAWRAGAEV